MSILRIQKQREEGQTLVAALIVIAIICVLMVVVMKGSGAFEEQKNTRPDGKGTTLPGMVMAQSEDTVCRSNLNQMRMSIGVYETSNGSFPASLNETQLGAPFQKCPLGGEPYSYDPSTGKVTCPHLGHEKY